MGRENARVETDLFQHAMDNIGTFEDSISLGSNAWLAAEMLQVLKVFREMILNVGFYSCVQEKPPLI